MLFPFTLVGRAHVPTVSNWCPPKDLSNTLVGSIRALNLLVRCTDIMLHSAPVSSLNVTWVSLTSRSDWMFLLELHWIASMYSPLMIHFQVTNSSFFDVGFWFQATMCIMISPTTFVTCDSIGRAVFSVVSRSTEFAFDYLPPILSLLSFHCWWCFPYCLNATSLTC